MARDIPGFYFDEDKGKYFRIQQSHKAIPGTGYTVQSIKAADSVKQDRQRLERQVKRQRATKIHKSLLSLHTTSPLQARLGASVQQNIDYALRQYCLGLVPDYVGAAFPLTPNDSHGGYNFCITRSGVLRVTYSDRTWLANQPFQNDVCFRGFENYYHTGSRPSADLITTLYDGDEECAIVLSDGSPSFTILSGERGGLSLGLGRSSVEMEIRAHGVETIWDIATAREHPSLAVATDKGLRICDVPTMDEVEVTNISGIGRKEQMNVCFKDSHIVMSGERSGRVHFSDRRNMQSVTRLLHSSAVVATQPLNDPNLVLTHGYSTTAIYDLRWTKPAPPRPHHSARRQIQPPSEPYISFAVPPNRYTDHYSRGRKVAYSSDLNLIVAASSNATHNISGYVTLYSAKTGRIVDSRLSRERFSEGVRCVDIKRVRDGPESIFCLFQSCLMEWGHGLMDEKETEFYGVGNERSFSGGTGMGLSFEQEWERSMR